MRVLKFSSTELVLLIILLVKEAFGNYYFDTKENFCGWRLGDTLHELCELYYSPPKGSEESNRHGHIVEECCKTPCSRRYLIDYYCLEPHREILRKLAEDTVYDPIFEPMIDEDFGIGNGNEADDITTKAAKVEMSKPNLLTRVKKSRRVESWIKKLRRDAPPPNVGRIETFQPAFYIMRAHKK